MNIVVGHLYPELLNLYGDRGNIICLQKRCLWRGLEFEIKPIAIETALNQKEMDKIDILFMGGGEDCGQKQLYYDFVNNKGRLIKQHIENAKAGLFVCGGYQLLGNYYRPYQGQDIQGLKIFDMYTQHFGRDKKRCVGNVVCQIQGPKYLKNKTLVGFENHGGRSFLNKSLSPLARTNIGDGNNGQDQTEGAIYKNTIGTYLHGPILPKNPHLADYLIKTALEKKYSQKIELTVLDDEVEWTAHKNALKLTK
ncbi:MAG: glutamine amidotransferase [Candidatus Magasanikbacteria bacterium CG10_big_fil_rev_8_21_14_0_10_40_10]|uniref:Lipid II isoglutaminyl synthase (glutamine-hydrolyzing) subunit GatD n=1 Tax=Candidatus Magasanikbacteria bacterium CG10_big_fil_rev_8_21_14_0_10_40_10 TaxID=1974648 RepID=A0A2M6W355_9BACT|nr:MAG: glutamine amidotransferase [Candidatus Magasanikbacteria bacterium CG10_big_fil_rev_8_21_14_0_10_40_10]